MTRQLLAMLACYTLGLVAGNADKTAPAPVIHCVEAQRSVSAEPAVQPDTLRSPVVQPVKTPLVEKVLPQPAKVQAKVQPTILDGQLSPRGEWQWSQAQGAWVPVAKAGPLWRENGHSATIDHLVRDHGYRRADLVKLTQSQLDVLHSNSHNSARARRVSAPTYSSCPSGRCPRR
jgi:hypothetical protein